MEPIYTAGKATVKQVVTWANNDDIETMLLATKEKIVDVTTKFSEDASIQTANPEDVKNQELSVTAPVVQQPETKLVVTNAKEMADAMYAYYSSFSPSFEIQYKVRNESRKLWRRLMIVPLNETIMSMVILVSIPYVLNMVKKQLRFLENRAI